MDDPRDVVVIIYKILDAIPTNEEVLQNELKQYLETLWNQAPEIRRSKYCWAPLLDILQRHIPDIDEDWKHRVLHIFNGTE